MAGGTVFSINDGIMSGALVPVTVAGIDVKIVQLGEDGQFIGQGLLDVALMNLVEFLEQTQATGAFEIVEEEARVGAVIQICAMSLEKGAACRRFVKGAPCAYRNPVGIGELRTLPQGGAGGDELDGGGEEFIANSCERGIYHAR